MISRVPQPDDFLIPSREGRNRTTNHMLHKFHEDLERIALRRRRQYDSRRTFISLAQGDGARKDIFRWITHGPEGDIVDLYTTLPWATLCAEVVKLKIGLREGRLIVLPKLANSSDYGGGGNRRDTRREKTLCGTRGYFVSP